MVLLRYIRSSPHSHNLSLFLSEMIFAFESTIVLLLYARVNRRVVVVFDSILFSSYLFMLLY